MEVNLKKEEEDVRTLLKTFIEQQQQIVVHTFPRDGERPETDVMREYV